MSDGPSQNNIIRYFVRESLGCGCPDEVFEVVRVRSRSDILGVASTVYEIGGRLFVAVVAPGDWHEIAPMLAGLVDAGKHYRDRHGFNRFRLVIASANEEAALELPALFDRLQNIDDKTHLHVIRPELLPHHVKA